MACLLTVARICKVKDIPGVVDSLKCLAVSVLSIQLRRALCGTHVLPSSELASAVLSIGAQLPR